MSTTHGHTKNGSTSPEWNSWRAMVNRCTHPTHKNWKTYGAIGITVCKEWLGPGGFDNFFAHMGKRPEGTTLDRIDVTKGYFPGNCRWASNSVQSKNKRTSRRLVYRGQSKLLTEWASEFGLKRECLRDRLDKLGWNITKALNTPVQYQRK